MTHSTIDEKEIQNFSSLASTWWDEDGPFSLLHQMNRLRIPYIKEKIFAHYSHIKFEGNTLTGIKILDVGCGGGILSIPLSRLGADVTGIDASQQNIEVAKAYAKEADININYLHTTVEKLPKNTTFDVVCCLEIIEHVAEPDFFLKHVCRVLKSGGIAFISTINRTLSSYLKAIIGAEYILRLVPVGTHDWNKFLKPSQIVEMLDKNKVELLDLSGMSYNYLTQEWHSSKDLKDNYILTAQKNVR